MITNADMTVFNYWYNPDTKQKEYRPTWIRGVHWHAEQKTAIENGGIVSADQYKIRIPDHALVQMRREFVDPKRYSQMGVGEVDLYWTADKSDLIARGIVYEPVTSLKELKQKYAEVGKIQSCSINLFGGNPHIRIGGAE